jgi:hypothetical protein
MTANERESGSLENAAGDDSVAYTTDYSDTDRVDVATALSLKQIDDAGVSVEIVQDELLALRFHDDLLAGRIMIEADRAEWLAEQLLDHAAAVREDRDGEA